MNDRAARLGLGLLLLLLPWFTLVPPAGAQVACPGPYHVTAPDGRCVWSCSQGTQPNNQTNECTCQPGLTETSKDQFGRRVCTAACPGPYHVTAPDGRCVWSCSQGTQPNAQTNECACQPGLTETSKDQFGRRVCTAACPGPYHVTAPDGRCVWSCSQGTQPNAQTNECACQPGLTETSKDQFGRRVCTCPKPYHVTAPDGRCVWSCGQGTQPNARTNECACQPGLKDAGKDNFGRLTCKK